jgi:RNA polymerase sigma factor (sigma-70 family)
MSKRLKDIDTLDKLREGDRKTLERIYDEFRESFCVWATYTYQCSENEAVEVYQKAFTIFYFNIKNGKLTVLTSSLKTYMYSIGKNVFRELFRSRKKSTPSLDNEELRILEREDSGIEYNILEAYDNAHLKSVVHELLDKIGDPCQTLLKLAFLKGYSTEAIVSEMGYSDERVVRKRKSLCIKKLREKYSAYRNLL